MRIILTGSKASGKSSVGRLLADALSLPVFETDEVLEGLYEEQTGVKATCREICRQIGEPAFRALEKNAVAKVASVTDCVICTGGQTMVDPESRAQLCEGSVTVFLFVHFDKVWERIEAQGFPPFFPEDNPRAWYKNRVESFRETVTPVCNVVLDVTENTLGEACRCVQEAIAGKQAG